MIFVRACRGCESGPTTFRLLAILTISLRITLSLCPHSLTHTHSLHLSPQRFDEFSFHIVNVIAHCLATVLTLPLFRALLASSGLPHHVALSASAMFASHPIHTDAVSSIVSRGEPLSAIMYILSLLTYMAVSSPPRTPRGFLLEVVRHAILLPLSAGLAFVGMLCKEMAITVVGIQVRGWHHSTPVYPQD